MKKNLVFEKETIASLSNDEQKGIPGGKSGLECDWDTSTHPPCVDNTVFDCLPDSKLYTFCNWQWDCVTRWQWTCD